MSDSQLPTNHSESPNILRTSSAPESDVKKKSPIRIARLGSAEYSSMTRSVENLGVLEKFKVDPKKEITMLDDFQSIKNKNEIWKGVKDYRRPKVWRKILKIDPEDSWKREERYSACIEMVFFKEIPSHVQQEVAVPDFGGVILMNSHDLTERQQEALSMLLCILQAEHSQVTYCPILPDLVAILVKYLPPADVFHVVSKMLEDEVLPSTPREHAVFTAMTHALTKKYCRALVEYAEKLGVKLLDSIGVWSARIFTSYLPYECVLRIMDCLIAEGRTVLHKVCVSLLQMYGPKLVKAQSAEEFSTMLAMLMRTRTNAGQLMDAAADIRLSSSLIHNLDKNLDVSHVPFHKVQVFSVPHFDEKRPSQAATTKELRNMWMWLPNLLRIEEPVVLFDSHHDGYNLDSFLDLVRQKQAHREPIFILTKGKDSPPIGMFIDWSTKRGYLDENSFLFRLGQRAKHWKLNERRKSDKCYKRLRKFIVQRAKEAHLLDSERKGSPEKSKLKLGNTHVHLHVDTDPIQERKAPPASPQTPTPRTPSQKSEKKAPPGSPESKTKEAAEADEDWQPISRTTTDFRISYNSFNKAKQEASLSESNAKLWLNDVEQGEEVKGEEVKTSYCEDSAKKFMFEACLNPEVKFLFEKYDTNGSGTLEKADALNFFKDFLGIVFRGGSLSKEHMEKIKDVGSQKLWARRHRNVTPPVILWQDLISNPNSNNSCDTPTPPIHDNGAWVFIDQHKGVGIGVGKIIAMQIHPDLKSASTAKTEISPCLAPYTGGEVLIYGLEVWGLTMC
mmetsp:Transcript_31795/g.77486  ORF Transcript_31795/g.77486 Transcript_31795/m.77486 type:complete len:788 (+) Transcript_31795:160-2523(+)